MSCKAVERVEEAENLQEKTQERHKEFSFSDVSLNLYTKFVAAEGES